MKNSILNFAASLVIAAFCFISCDKSSNQENTFKYLAVQIDEGDNWSIVDEDGNIVVDREYSSDYKISPISNDGTYWVYSDSEKRYQLFSIDSPKHPIINTEYEQALRFVNNKAFVCDGNNPIQIINENGKIIKTLSKDICEVSLPAKLVSQHKRFLYKNNKGLYGYLDKEGNIIIPAKYQNAKHFSDDLALVKREINSSQWDVIDQFGEVVYGRIDENKYDLDYDYSFSNGMIAATEVNEEGALVYLNKNGEIALRPKKIYKKGPQYECGPEGFSFKDGIAVVIDKSDNVCVIDEQGECIIRPGKYSKIHYLGNGHFAVASNENNKWKIVDINDNPISDNSFGQLLYLKLGDKYIAYDKVFYLVNQKGEEVKNVEFDNIDWVANNQITYVDFEHIAAELVQNLDSTGYTPLNGNIRPKEIASIFNLAPQENLRNKRYIELPSDTIDNIWVEVSVNFNARAQVEKTHYETVSDGWFAYRRTISDGWSWNDDAELADIYLEIKNLPFYSSNSLQNLCKKIEEALLQKGFKKLDDQYSYEACNGNSYTVISLNSRDKFSIKIYPNRNFSELDNECF